MHYKASFLGTPVLKIDKCFLALSLCSAQVHLSGFECIWQEWQDRNLISAQINQSIKHNMGYPKHCRGRPWIPTEGWSCSWHNAWCSTCAVLLQQLPQGKWEIWRSESQSYLLKLVNVRVFPLLPTPYPTHQLHWTVGGSS